MVRDYVPLPGEPILYLDTDDLDLLGDSAWRFIEVKDADFDKAVRDSTCGLVGLLGKIINFLNRHKDPAVVTKHFRLLSEPLPVKGKSADLTDLSWEKKEGQDTQTPSRRDILMARLKTMDSAGKIVDFNNENHVLTRALAERYKEKSDILNQLFEMYERAVERLQIQLYPRAQWLNVFLRTLHGNVQEITDAIELEINGLISAITAAKEPNDVAGAIDKFFKNHLKQAE